MAIGQTLLHAYYIMIGYVKGRITLKNPAFIYVECAGVGYHINISLHTYSKIEKLEEATILTHLNLVAGGMAESQMNLYGFYEEEERELFAHLITASGISCNTARLMLSYMSPEELRNAIIQENEPALISIKGIGAKTAKKIILELKDKIIKKAGIDKNAITRVTTSPIREEALAAMVALGFPKASIEKQISAALSKKPDVQNVEELIKTVLKQMN